MDYIPPDHHRRPYALARTEEPVSAKLSSNIFLTQGLISLQWRPCWILKFTVTTNCMEGAKLPVLLLSVRYKWRCSENLRKTSFKIRRRKSHMTEGLSLTPWECKSLNRHWTNMGTHTDQILPWLFCDFFPILEPPWLLEYFFSIFILCEWILMSFWLS